MAEYNITVMARVSQSPLQEIIDLDRTILSLSRQYREVKELCDYLGRQIAYSKKRKDELERQQTRITVCPPAGKSVKRMTKEKEDVPTNVADVLQGLGIDQMRDLVTTLSAMMESDDEIVEESETK